MTEETEEERLARLKAQEDDKAAGGRLLRRRTQCVPPEATQDGYDTSWEQEPE
jgi:hypothetical protein